MFLLSLYIRLLILVLIYVLILILVPVLIVVVAWLPTLACLFIFLFNNSCSDTSLCSRFGPLFWFRL